MTGFEIRPLVVPASLDNAEAADFIGMVDARNAVLVPIMGEGARSTPATQLPRWQLQAGGDRRGFVAVADGAVVGRSLIEIPRGDATEAYVDVFVVTAFRRRGIGAALLEPALSIAREHGSAVAQGMFPLLPSLSSDAPTLSPPNGMGAIPRSHPGVTFALHHGFELGQVLRGSALALPTEPERLDRLERDAAAAFGAEYALVRFEGATPHELIDDMAVLHGRMTTDAPQGDLQITEQVWDADRVRAHDREWLAAGYRVLTTAARHQASGHLVAFTFLLVAEDTRSADQMDTLVLREHRGHRLGMGLKVANLRWLEAKFPAVSTVDTMNAEENMPMLAVNIELGFTPAYYTSGWKLQLR